MTRSPAAVLDAEHPRAGRSCSARVRVLVAIGIAWLALQFALRLALLLDAGLGEIHLTTLAAIARGSLIDAAVAGVLLSGLGVLLALVPGGGRLHPFARFAVLAALFAVATFSAFVEYFFFDEFDARFNHIALDYLLFPGEVAGNVWESYPVPIYVALAALAGCILGTVVARAMGRDPLASLSAARRALGVGASIAGGACAVGLLWIVPEPRFGDRRVDEISSNGLVQLARAYSTAGLSYDDYYATVPEPERQRRVAEELGWADLESPGREFRAAGPCSAPLDVVVILGESFGSEFVGCLGGDKPCAPGFDRWSREGLLLTNLMATGNRTVRGLEGVLCSFVPLPGDSIWKRDKSEDIATVARVLQGRGYRTEFVYGGAGTFDGMRSFALQNGWDRFIEDGLVGSSDFPDDAFRTVWGVADEFVFDELLERQSQAAKDGVRYFGTALTVSNHKPYLNPDSPSFGLRGERLAQSARWGAALLVLSVVGWRLAGGRWSLGRKAALLALVWSAFLVHAWSEAQPRDSRRSALGYADRALAAYLDRAREQGLLEHTVVLFVGDHGARVYGAEEIPAASYRIPALFLSPDPQYRGRTIDRLCSQIDLGPTLLSMAGVDHSSPFFGVDLLALPPDGPGRAWLIHNRDVGLLTDESLTVLGLQRAETFYERSDRTCDRFVLVESGDQRPELLESAARAAAVFQAASQLYEERRYRLGHVP